MVCDDRKYKTYSRSVMIWMSMWNRLFVLTYFVKRIVIHLYSAFIVHLSVIISTNCFKVLWLVIFSGNRGNGTGILWSKNFRCGRILQQQQTNSKWNKHGIGVCYFCLLSPQCKTHQRFYDFGLSFPVSQVNLYLYGLNVRAVKFVKRVQHFE